MTSRPIPGLKTFLATMFLLLLVTPSPGLTPDLQAPSQNTDGPAQTVPPSGNVIEIGPAGMRLTLPKDFEPPLRIKVEGVPDSFPIFLSTSQSGTFSFGSLQLPNSIEPAEENIAAVLNGFRDEQLKNLGGILEKEVPISNSHGTGRSCLIRKNENRISFFFRMDIILGKDRLYLIIFQSFRKEVRDSEAIKAVFSSFGPIPVLATAPTAPSPAGDSKPIAFTSDEGRFSIEFPPGSQKPVDQTPDLNRNNSKSGVHQFVALGPEGPASVSYFDTGGPPGKPVSKGVLDSFQGGLLGSFGKTTSSVNEIPWKGRVIRKIAFKGELYNGPMYGIFYIITDGTRIYVLGMIADRKEYLDGPAGENYLNSFRILPKP